MNNKPVYSICLADNRRIRFDDENEYEKYKHFDCRNTCSHVESENKIK